jgi:hypothetical protein
MSVSRVKRGLTRHTIAVCCGAALVCGAPEAFPDGAAQAQVGPPVQLVPAPRAPRDRAAPAPAAPAASTPAASTPAAPARAPVTTVISPNEAPTMPGRVVVDQLKALEPDSVGLLEDNQGGLGTAMWRGTTRATVERLLPLVPPGMNSRVGRDLARRLLMTRATAPQGASAGAAGSLLGIRAERLLEMGEERSSVALLRLGPPQSDEELSAHTEVEAQFLDNERGAACDRVQSLSPDRKNVYWLEARAFCLALAGDTAQAVVIADLLRDQREDLELVFFAAIDVLAGGPAVTVDRVDTLNGLHLAMARVAKLKLPDTVADVERPVLLSTVVKSPNISLEARLRAAERAAAYGTLTGEELGDFYLAVPFTPDELRQPATLAAASWGPRARALLARAAVGAANPTAAAEAVRTALRLAREKGGLDAVVAGSLRAMSAIRPASEIGWFAGDAARILFANGKRDEALAWIRVLEESVAASPEAAAALSDLQPLRRLATPEQVASLGPVAQAAPAPRPGENTAAAARRAFIVKVLLDAAERSTGSTSWSAYVGANVPNLGPTPDPIIWQALSAAARDGRIGETILLSLIALGPGGTSNAHPLTVSSVIDALRAIGLESEARAVVLEAAIAAGV